MLGPFLYLLYTADISSLFVKHLNTGHLYADDAQACMHNPPVCAALLVVRIVAVSQGPSSMAVLKPNFFKPVKNPTNLV